MRSNSKFLEKAGVLQQKRTDILVHSNKEGRSSTSSTPFIQTGGSKGDVFHSPWGSLRPFYELSRAKMGSRSFRGLLGCFLG